MLLSHKEQTMGQSDSRSESEGGESEGGGTTTSYEIKYENIDGKRKGSIFRREQKGRELLEELKDMTEEELDRCETQHAFPTKFSLSPPEEDVEGGGEEEREGEPSSPSATSK